MEVEGENVSLENHGQVVTRIASAGLGLTMLVVDQECEEFHRTRNIVITSSLPHTVRFIVMTYIMYNYNNNCFNTKLHHFTRQDVRITHYTPGELTD